MTDYNAQTEIYCNNGCGKKSAMADIKPLVEVVQHKSHVERYYFNCPFCGEKYICFYSDNQVKAWQGVMAATKDAHLKKKLALRIKDRMQRLKDTYGG